MGLSKRISLNQVIVNFTSGLITVREVTEFLNNENGEVTIGNEVLRRYVLDGRQQLVSNMPEDTLIVTDVGDVALAAEGAIVAAIAEAVWTGQILDVFDSMAIQAVGLCEISFIDQIEIDPALGFIGVRQNTSTFDDGAYQAHKYHRHAVSPNDDLSGQHAAVAAIAGAVWTPDVVAAFQQAVIIANKE